MNFLKKNLNNRIIKVAEAGNREELTILLNNNRGFDLNYSGKDGETALEKAAKKGHLNIVQLLLTKNASEKDKALYYAIIEENNDIAELLIEKGANLAYALITASGEGNLNAVEKLLEKGVDIDCSHILANYTPLGSAIINNRENVVKLLLEEGAKVNIISMYPEPNCIYGICSYPLKQAIKENNVDIAVQLIEHGADVDAGTLSLAVKSSYEMVEALLEFEQVKNTINTPNEYERLTALETAVNCSDFAIVELLLHHGAKSKKLLNQLRNNTDRTVQSCNSSFSDYINDVNLWPQMTIPLGQQSKQAKNLKRQFSKINNPKKPNMKLVF